MVSDVEKTRPNYGILVSRDRNCSRMTVGNISKHALHKCGISNAIERWDLIYWEVNKGKVISKFRLSGIL